MHHSIHLVAGTAVSVCYRCPGRRWEAEDVVWLWSVADITCQRHGVAGDARRFETGPRAE
jgi:hypothetical protein